MSQKMNYQRARRVDRYDSDAMESERRDKDTVALMLECGARSTKRRLTAERKERLERSRALGATPDFRAQPLRLDDARFAVAVTPAGADGARLAMVCGPVSGGWNDVWQEKVRGGEPVDWQGLVDGVRSACESESATGYLWQLPHLLSQASMFLDGEACDEIMSIHREIA